MINNPNDETNVSHRLLLTNIRVANPCKAFANETSNDIKLSETQLSKMIRSCEFLGRLSVPLLKTGLPLMENVIKPLANKYFNSIRINCAESAADAGIHKKTAGL